jgi:hypothetical protein
MKRVRKCDRRCHQAKGKRCYCWCGGAFHGEAGAANRQALHDNVEGVLEQHGFETGKTAYIEQKTLLEVPDANS